MTDTGIQNLKNRIAEVPIDIPSEPVNAHDLTFWLLGYNKCLENVMAVLDSFVDKSR